MGSSIQQLDQHNIVCGIHVNLLKLLSGVKYFDGEL